MVINKWIKFVKLNFLREQFGFLGVWFLILSMFYSLSECFYLLLSLLPFLVFIFFILQRLNEKIKEQTDFNNHLEYFFIAGLDLFCIADNAGNFIRVNNEWEKILGYSMEELLQRKFLEFVHPDDMQATLNAMSELANQRQVLNFTNRYRCKDGSYHFIEWRSMPCGNLIYAAARDVTERKKYYEILNITKEALENSTDAIGILTPLGDHYYHNKAFCKIFGDVKECFMSTAFVDGTMGDIILKTLKAGGSWCGDVQMYSHHHKVLDINLRAYAVKDDGGKIVALAGIYSDVTESKRVENELALSQEKYRHFFENEIVGFILHEVIYDKNDNVVDTIIREVNPAYERMLRLKAQDIIGHRAKEVLPYIDESILENYSTVLKSNKPVAFQKFLPSLQLFFDAWAFSPAPTKVALLFVDITDKKIVENQLIVAKENAEKAERVKSQFLANMSHEIRTPMNTVLGMADLLCETSLSSEQQYYVNIIQKSGEVLTDLISSVLDISSIEAGTLRIENTPFDLKEVLESTLDIMKLKVEMKGLRIGLTIFDEVKTLLIGDALHLKQILLNLVSNSFKFTEKGEINISAALSHMNGVNAVIKFLVSDTGIGIHPDEMDKLFTRFSQIDSSRTKKYSGTGLGLSICKQLVELLGGEISVSSVYGQGTTFCFILPFRIQDDPIITKINKMDDDLFLDHRPLRILVAEDSEDNQILIQLFLKKTPYVIDMVQNGQEALAKFKSNEYDIILMDVQMPVMDGLLATQQIRLLEKERDGKSIPILACSAYSLQEDRSQIIEAGCNGLLTKPLKKIDLLRAIYVQVNKESK